jgi:hypothetical protein
VSWLPEQLAETYSLLEQVEHVLQNASAMLEHARLINFPEGHAEQGWHTVSTSWVHAAASNVPDAQIVQLVHVRPFADEFEEFSADTREVAISVNVTKRVQQCTILAFMASLNTRKKSATASGSVVKNPGSEAAPG